jgi:hypothetical protein
VMPQTGDTLAITAAASVQFAATPPFRFRVNGVTQYGSTPTGMVWISGYVLDENGLATARRNLLVITAGLHPADPTPPIPARTPANRGPHIPKQRTTSTPARSHR